MVLEHSRVRLGRVGARAHAVFAFENGGQRKAA
jgi:hypothetical protein